MCGTRDHLDSIRETCARQNPETKAPTDKRKQLSDVDYAPTNSYSSQGEFQLYIFEDNEAMILMITKGRSPTMRHVSRTHRVALHWLFDRINLEPKFQIKNVDTKDQLADMLTKESVSRDEWNHLLRWFNIMSFSMFSCSHYSDFLFDPIGKQSAMSNRGQEATSGEGSPMAIPKPMVPTKARPLNLVSRSPWSERNSSQNFGYLVNPENAECGNSLQTASKSEIIVSKHEIHEPSTHDLDLSVLTKDFGRYSKLLNFLNKSSKNKCVNMGIFMSSSMKAAIHLGPNCLANLEVYKNTNFEENISLFNITQMMILEHSEEILNVKPLESSSPSWTRSVLSHDQAITWTKAKVRVYSDSVLFVGKMNDSKDAITRWEGQVEEFKMYPSYKELSGIDGEAIEFEWNIFPGLSSLQILQEIQQDLDRKIHSHPRLHLGTQDPVLTLLERTSKQPRH